MKYVCVVIAVLFAWFLPRSASSAAEDIQRWGLYTGSCRPPDGVTPPIALCLQGDIWIESRHATKAEPLDRAALGTATGSAGVFLGGMVSLYGRATAQRISSYSPDERGIDGGTRETTDLFLQLGNPAAHPIALQIGRGPLPFGMQHQVFHPSLTDLLSNRLFPQPAPQLRFALDNQHDRHLDVAFANASFPRKRVTENETTSEERAEKSALDRRDIMNDSFTFRFFQDYPELYATRLGISGYGVRSGVRQVGASLMNRTPKDETTVVEFTRKRLDPSIETGADETGVRVTYMGPWVQDTRVEAQIEDLSSLYRMGGLGAVYRMGPVAVFNVTIAYLRSEDDGVRSRWILLTGLGAVL